MFVAVPPKKASRCVVLSGLRRSVLHGVMLTLCTVVVSPSVRGAETDGPLAIDYHAPAECPTRVQFIGEVTKRLDAVPGQVAPAEWSVRVEGGRPKRGWLQRKNTPGHQSARYFEAESCEELVQLLALAAALAMHAREPQRTQPESTTVTVPSVRAIRSTPAEPATPASHWDAGVGLTIERAWGLLPEAAWRPGLVVQAARGRGAFVPVFRLGVGVARQSREIPGLGSAEFDLVAGRFEGCWPRLLLGTRLELMPCASLEAGSLSAEGRDVPASRSVSNPWFAGGTALRASLDVASWLAFEGAGSLSFPAYHTRYIIEPDITAHELPGVTGAIQMGAIVRF